ncbi:MAG: M23 family metallopeptidase, partial [Deltaproteobacteria bacterium]
MYRKLRESSEFIESKRWRLEQEKQYGTYFNHVSPEWIRNNARKSVWLFAKGIRNNFQERSFRSGHRAYDIFAALDSPIRAFCSGVVVAAGDGWKFDDSGAWVEGTGLYRQAGNGLIIYNPALKSYSYYAHLGRVEIQAGAIVAAADIVGTVGNSGLNARKKEPHLHFEYSVVNKEGNLVAVRPSIALKRGASSPVEHTDGKFNLGRWSEQKEWRASQMLHIDFEAWVIDLLVAVMRHEHSGKKEGRWLRFGRSVYDPSIMYRQAVAELENINKDTRARKLFHAFYRFSRSFEDIIEKGGYLFYPEALRRLNVKTWEPELARRHEKLLALYRYMIQWALKGRLGYGRNKLAKLYLYRGISSPYQFELSMRLDRPVFTTESKAVALKFMAKTAEESAQAMLVYENIPTQAINGYWKLYPDKIGYPKPQREFNIALWLLGDAAVKIFKTKAAIDKLPENSFDLNLNIKNRPSSSSPVGGRDSSKRNERYFPKELIEEPDRIIALIDKELQYFEAFGKEKETYKITIATQRLIKRLRGFVRNRQNNQLFTEALTHAERAFDALIKSKELNREDAKNIRLELAAVRAAFEQIIKNSPAAGRSTSSPVDGEEIGKILVQARGLLREQGKASAQQILNPLGIAGVANAILIKHKPSGKDILFLGGRESEKAAAAALLIEGASQVWGLLAHWETIFLLSRLSPQRFFAIQTALGLRFSLEWWSLVPDPSDPRNCTYMRNQTEIKPTGE